MSNDEIYEEVNLDSENETPVEIVEEEVEEVVEVTPDTDMPEPEVEPEPPVEEKPKRNSRKKPKESKTKQKPSDGEVWVDNVGMQMLRKGHSQRNVIFRAIDAAGVDRAAGTKAFSQAKGSLRDKLIAIFS